MSSIALSDSPSIHFPSSGYVELPMRRATNHVLVEAIDANGVPNTFFLDTGASHSVVTSRYSGAGESLAADQELGSAVGVAGEIPLGPQPFQVRDLRLGDLALESFSAVQLDVPGLDEEFEGGIHGILGFNVLCHWLTVIDYRRERVQLIDPTRESELGWPPPSYVLPFELYLGAIIRLEGQVNGRAVSFLIDIGSAYTILNRPAAATSGIAFEADAEFDYYGNAQGERPESGTAESLVVGSLALIRRKLYRFNMPPFAAVGLDQAPAGILGNDVLERFRVMIDYGRRELRLWNGH